MTGSSKSRYLLRDMVPILKNLTRSCNPFFPQTFEGTDER